MNWYDLGNVYYALEILTRKEKLGIQCRVGKDISSGTNKVTEFKFWVYHLSFV